jgi:hypothetical protein
MMDLLPDINPIIKGRMMRTLYPPDILEPSLPDVPDEIELILKSFLHNPLPFIKDPNCPLS